MIEIKKQRPEPLKKCDFWLDKLCVRKHYYRETEQSLYKARKVSNKEKYQPVCVQCKKEERIPSEHRQPRFSKLTSQTLAKPGAGKDTFVKTRSAASSSASLSPSASKKAMSKSLMTN
jgi:hypothetical protein